MPYVSPVSASNRAGVVAAVGALHVAALLAVSNGLTVAFIPVDNPPPISATNTPLEAEPPHRLPPPRPTSLPHDPAPEREIRIDLGAGSLPLPVFKDPGPGPIVDPLPDPRPTAPVYAARAARPLGDRAGWVSEADYPSRELRLGQSGAVGFVLAVDAAGRVSGCTVTRSSGYAGLDDVTCRLVSRRARFEPSRDERGLATPGTYQGTVRWQIPD